MSVATEPSQEPTNSAAEQFARRQRSPVQRLQQLLHARPAISPFVVLIVSAIVFTLINERFFYATNISLILQQVAITAALAIGQTLIILTAGIDLSVGAIAILSMVVMANLTAENGVPAVLAILIGVAVGTACGAINGLLVTRLSLPPFIVTLGTLSVFTAAALLYTGGESITGTAMPDLMSWTDEEVSAGQFSITTGVLVVLVLYLVVAFALSQTMWGRHVYAVGDDAEGARLTGIKTKRVLLSVYTVAGLIYGITAWVIIGRAGTVSTNALPIEANLESITAVVIGGTSLFGGRGVLVGTAIGALIVGSFQSGLSLAGVDAQWRVLTIGALVIVAVSVDQWIRKVRA